MKKLLYILLMTGNLSFAQEKTVPTTQPAVTPSVSPTAPEITFTETNHDFGNLKKGSQVVYKFKYKNTGKEPLIISECRAGCHCTTAKCSKEPLKPGKTSFIEVHYDSMRVGDFTKEVIVISNAKNSHTSVSIKGMILGEAEGTDSPAKNEEKMKSTENKKE